MHFARLQPFLTGAACLAVTSVAGPAAGSVIDPMDNTDYFTNSFFGRTSIDANGDSTVTLTRDDDGAGTDSGADWGDANKGGYWVDWNPGVDRLELDPVGPVNTNRGGTNNDDRYSVQVQYRDGAGSYLGAGNWVNQSNSADQQVLPSVASFAEANNASGFEQFRLRFRIFPASFDTASDPTPASLTTAWRPSPHPAR
jgi:hypothetical protein